MAMEYLLSDKTGEILRAFYDVYNELGYGFLERVYKNALYKELKKRGFDCSTERSIPDYPQEVQDLISYGTKGERIPVYYQGELVGDFYADIIVDNKVILELKAVKHILPEHEAQLTNYLRATDAEVGLLLNFGPEPQKRRVVFTNDRKKAHVNLQDQSFSPAKISPNQSNL